MHVFGCLPFATVLNPSSKFSPRATKCIFIGYPMGQKAYKLYDIATKKFFINRDVFFHEDTFHHSPQVAPNTNSTPPKVPISIPLILILFLLKKTFPSQNLLPIHRQIHLLVFPASPPDDTLLSTAAPPLDAFPISPIDQTLIHHFVVLNAPMKPMFVSKILFASK